MHVKIYREPTVRIFKLRKGKTIQLPGNILSPELESNPDPSHYDLWGNVHTHTHAPSCNDVNLSNKKWSLLSVSIVHHERFSPVAVQSCSASIATRQVTTAYVHVKHRDCTVWVLVAVKHICIVAGRLSEVQQGEISEKPLSGQFCLFGWARRLVNHGCLTRVIHSRSHKSQPQTCLFERQQS